MVAKCWATVKVELTMRTWAGVAMTLLFAASIGTLAQGVTLSMVPRDNILLATYCQAVIVKKVELENRYLQSLPPEVRDDPRMEAITRRSRDDFDRLTLYLSPPIPEGFPLRIK